MEDASLTHQVLNKQIQDIDGYQDDDIEQDNVTITGWWRSG